MRRQWLDSRIQAVFIVKEWCLTENCDTDVLTILNTHDNTCDNDASDEHTTPEPEWNPIFKWYGILNLLHIDLLEGISVETTRERTHHSACYRIDGFPVAGDFRETRAK